MCKIREMNLETAKYYGYEAQSNQLVEECAELIQAVNKYRRVETGLGQPVAEDKKAIDFTMSKVNKEAGSDERHGFASATGNCGASSATGNCGASSATGYKGASSATGNCGASSATGYKGASSVSDPTGVAVAWGHEARAKGCKGAHLILSDWKYVGARYSDGDYMDPYDKESWELTGAKMVVVDGEKIKEDTYYRCIEGEIVEVTEDGEIVEE